MGSDLDFDVEFDWFMAHVPRIHTALKDAGWQRQCVFGKIGQWGYEEAWVIHGVKADLFSVALLERGKYVEGLTIGGKTFPCYVFYERRQWHTWNKLTFPVPAPIDTYLEKMYGTTWPTPHTNGYRWDVEPFRTEHGRLCCVREEMPVRKSGSGTPRKSGSTPSHA